MRRKKIKPKRVRVLKRFVDEEDDEREDVIGQPDEQDNSSK